MNTIAVIVTIIGAVMVVIGVVWTASRRSSRAPKRTTDTCMILTAPLALETDHREFYERVSIAASPVARSSGFDCHHKTAHLVWA